MQKKPSSQYRIVKVLHEVLDWHTVVIKFATRVLIMAKLSKNTIVL